MLTCIHLSDLHFKADQGYEQNLITEGLVAAVARYSSEGRAPDAILVTGDIAHSGKEPEYKRSSLFFYNLPETSWHTRFLSLPVDTLYVNQYEEAADNLFWRLLRKPESL
jgi:3',5'-cyclic AMP phosphodiesterase CpdA